MQSSKKAENSPEAIRGASQAIYNLDIEDLYFGLLVAGTYAHPSEEAVDLQYMQEQAIKMADMQRERKRQKYSECTKCGESRKPDPNSASEV